MQLNISVRRYKSAFRKFIALIFSHSACPMLARFATLLFPGLQSLKALLHEQSASATITVHIGI